MKFFKLSLCAIFILVFFSQCYRIAFNLLGITDKSVSLKKASNSTKEIVFIPMHHVGKQEFYNDVKNKMDSLRKNGFVFYYEGVKVSTMPDLLTDDTIILKTRKVIGLDMKAMQSNGGYIDTADYKIFGKKRKFIKKYKLVNQPKAASLYDTSIDRRVDVYLSEAIPALESKFGKIILNDCDFTTSHEEKYRCEKYKNKNGKKFITLTYRNEFIANEVMKDTHQKIGIIYGSRHFDGIVSDLQKLDSTWKIIQLNK